MRFLRGPAIALSSLVLFFALVEAGLRLSGHAPRGPVTPAFSWVDRGELYTMTPGRRWIMPLKKDLVRANSLGLRGPEIAPRKPGWQRILVLGDSVAFGYEVPEKEALPKLLGDALRGRGFRVETIGAAVPGWCARQHRLFIEQHGRAIDPDLIVATVVLNDIEELQLGQSELERSLRSANTLGWLAEHSALAAWLRWLLGQTVDPFGRDTVQVLDLAYHPDTPSSKKAMALERAEIAGLARAAKELGAPLVLILVPYRFQLDDPDADAPQRALRGFADENGVAALDLLPRLALHESKNVFSDKVHLSSQGNAIVAEEIAEWLTRRRLAGRLRKPDQTE